MGSPYIENQGLTLKTPPTLVKHGLGELDWMAMRALEKDRNRRYQSASALAADVLRYLNDEPWPVYSKTPRRPIVITATLDNQAITSALPTLTITVPTPATQFVISGLNPASFTAGGTATFTVTAEDNTGALVPSYTGSVLVTSTDIHAALNGNELPASYTFGAGDNGAHTFTSHSKLPALKPSRSPIRSAISSLPPALSP
jgi:hypothetical protein